jgi:hypothetical protein
MRKPDAARWRRRARALLALVAAALLGVAILAGISAVRRAGTADDPGVRPPTPGRLGAPARSGRGTRPVIVHRRRQLP